MSEPATPSSVSGSTIIVQFVSESGESTGPQINLPVETSTSQLETLVNHLLSNEEKVPYSFYINEIELLATVNKTIEEMKLSKEDVLSIVYQPQAVFKVKAVTRCSTSMSGHSEAVLNVCFSPDGNQLASGSGDTTVRVWDIETETPEHTLKGHTNWVLCVAFSPDGKKLATGGMDTTFRVWDPKTGKQIGSTMKGHTKYLTGIAWQPLHSNPKCEFVATSSKDGTVKIWDTTLSRCIRSLSSHTMSITSLRWAGDGLIYSASQDRTIKVWLASEGKLCRTLEGHAHWVNTIALNTDYALRTGSYDHTGKEYEKVEDAQKRALERYNEVLKSNGGVERLVSGSDDFTLILWAGALDKKPIARMTGHQAVVNLVSFSPDGRFIASASFDKSIKIWNGTTGKFITSFRAHVEAAYQVAWSSDSRLLVSGSKDSTLKIWDVHTKKMRFDLPGHADEVYWVDWAPDGQRVASGSKDRLVKIWKN